MPQRVKDRAHKKQREKRGRKKEERRECKRRKGMELKHYCCKLLGCESHAWLGVHHILHLHVLSYSCGVFRGTSGERHKLRGSRCKVKLQQETFGLHLNTSVKENDTS